MQPRGQLWFELQRVCQDFRDFSGLAPKEAAEVLVAVLGNLLSDEEERLKRLTAPAADAPQPSGSGGTPPP